ncbi:MAG: hypothetical protein KC496_04935 [Anaerolineae bacterium]|nr:hypothetical protein [Anaerolineae bacterium]
MSYPSQLPETPPKRKNRSPLRVIVNAWGCLLALIMLALGAALGLTGAIFFAPQILGFDATATALADDAIMLASTQADLDFRAEQAEDEATRFARDSDATRAALGSQEELVGQTATQSRTYLLATQTAIAADNIRQQTQIAIDYQATQVQLQENATAAEIDFRNTQAALGVQSNAIEPSAEAQALAVESVEEAAPPPTVTPMPTGVLIPASDTPTPTPAPLEIETDFSEGWQNGLWLASAAADWQTAEGGMQAMQNGAWLRSDAELALPYTAEFVFSPAVVLEAQYDLLLSVDGGEGLLLRLTTEALSLAEVNLYRFDSELLEDGTPLAEDMLLLESATISQSLTEQTVIRVRVDEDGLSAQLNDTAIFTADLLRTPYAGSVGIALPMQANLVRISLAERP